MNAHRRNYLSIGNIEMPFVRHCVECPKCLTRYVIAFSPYRNGSYLVRMGAGFTEEYILYCFCSNPPTSSRWKEEQIKRYLVCKAAYGRGYGTSEEIRASPATRRTSLALASL